MILLKLVLFFGLLVAICGCSNVTVTLGISVSSQSGSVFLDTNGKAVLDGLLYFEKVSSRIGLQWKNGSFIDVKIAWKEDYGNSSMVTSNYQDFVSDPSVNFLLGPISTPLSISARMVTEAANRLLLGTKSGSTSFYLNTRKVYSVTTSPFRYSTTVYPTFRLKGARTIVIIQEDTAFTRDIGTGFIRNARDYGIQVLHTYTVRSDALEGITPSFEKNISSIVEDLVSNEEFAKSGALVVASFSNVAITVLKKMKEINYTPKLFYVASMLMSDFETYDPELTKFITGCDIMANGVNFRDDYFGSYEEYLRDFESVMGKKGDINTAIGTVSGLLLALSVKNAQSIDDDEVTEQLRRINEDTFFGPYAFAPDHSQLRFVPYLQLVPSAYEGLPNEVRIIGPDRIQLNEVIYPMPSWDERIYVSKYTNEEFTIMGITAFGMAVSIALTIVIFVYRNNRVIKASSAKFMAFIMAGTLITYASNFVWTFGTVTTATCATTPLFAGIGITFTLAALFMKSWRIINIYEQSVNFHIKVISNLSLLGIVVAITVPQLAFSIVIAILNSVVQFHIEDPYRQSTWFEECTTFSEEHKTLVFGLIIASVVYNGGLLFFGIVMAFKMRIVKDKRFNEAKILAYIIYAITVLVIIVTAFHLSGTLDRSDLYILRGLGIIMFNLIIAGVLVGHKLYLVASGATLETSSSEKFENSASMSRKDASSVNVSRKEGVKQVDSVK